MPTYKLNYFSFRGKAEVLRQIFALADQEYEDNRIDFYSEWPQIKSTFVYGQLPVLEVDGKQLAQTNTIARFLAKKFGFDGANDWETAQIESLADQYEDFFRLVLPYFRVRFGVASGDENNLYETQVEPARDSFFPILTNILKKSKRGFLIGNNVSWVDLLIAEHVFAFNELKPGYAHNYTEIMEHLEKVQSIPRIRQWIETRPKTDF